MHRCGGLTTGGRSSTSDGRLWRGRLEKAPKHGAFSSRLPRFPPLAPHPLRVDCDWVTTQVPFATASMERSSHGPAIGVVASRLERVTLARLPVWRPSGGSTGLSGPSFIGQRCHRRRDRRDGRVWLGPGRSYQASGFAIRHASCHSSRECTGGPGRDDSYSMITLKSLCRLTALSGGRNQVA
jgi:hypothetical protein